MKPEAENPRIEAALREYLERIDRGEAVNRDDFISQNAEIAEALKTITSPITTNTSVVQKSTLSTPTRFAIRATSFAPSPAL